MAFLPYDLARFFFMDKPRRTGADAFGIDDAHQTEQELISSAINDLLTGPAHRSRIRRTTPYARACDGSCILLCAIKAG